MTTAQPVSKASKNLIFVGLGAALLVLFATSFLYRINNPETVRQVRHEAPEGMGQPGAMNMDRVSSLMKQLQEDPENPEVNLELAQMFTSVQSWDKALMFWKKAAEHDPRNLDIQRQMGMCAFHAEHYPEAEAIFETVVAAEPHDYVALFNLGVLKKYYSDKPAEAEAHFQTVINAPDATEDMKSHARKELETHGN